MQRMNERTYTRQLKDALREVMPTVKFHRSGPYYFDLSLDDWRAPVCVILKPSQIRFRFGNMQKKGAKYQWRYPSKTHYQTAKVTFTYDEFDVMAPYFAAMCRAFLLQDASLLPLPPLPMCCVEKELPVSDVSVWQLESGEINPHVYEHTIRGWNAQMRDYSPAQNAPTSTHA